MGLLLRSACLGIIYIAAPQCLEVSDALPQSPAKMGSTKFTGAALPATIQPIEELRPAPNLGDAEDPYVRLLPPEQAQDVTLPNEPDPDVNEHSREQATSPSNKSLEPPAEKESPALRLRTRSIFVEWWEEIASVIVSLVCMILALTVLLYMDNGSTDSWRLRIQPNSVVAFLATLTRAALIFPLAECLGHFRRTFFERPRTLGFMHTFDVASRGPLGASKFLWKTKINSPLASCAALTAILLLLSQPFMQQKIEFTTRSFRGFRSLLGPRFELCLDVHALRRAYAGGIGFASIWAHSDNPIALVPCVVEVSNNTTIPYSQAWFNKIKLGGVITPSETASELVRLIESGVARGMGGMIMTADVGIEEAPEYYTRFDRWEKIEVYISFI